MNEEEINKIVKEHYGFSVEEIDNMVGDLSLKNTKLRKKNKVLKQKVKAFIELLKYNQNINRLEGLENIVGIGYVISELEDILKES